MHAHCRLRCAQKTLSDCDDTQHGHRGQRPAGKYPNPCLKVRQQRGEVCPCRTADSETFAPRLKSNEHSSTNTRQGSWWRVGRCKDGATTSHGWRAVEHFFSHYQQGATRGYQPCCGAATERAHTPDHRSRSLPRPRSSQYALAESEPSDTRGAKLLPLNSGSPQVWHYSAWAASASYLGHTIPG